MNNDTNTVETAVENTATDNDTLRERLEAAGKKVVEQKAARRERTVKGSHLNTKFIELAQAQGLTVDEMSGFVKLTGSDKSKRVLIAKKGGRVDLSGFTVELGAVRQISETEAREKHLGKVRGQLDFEKTDEEVLSAFTAALEVVAKKAE